MEFLPFVAATIVAVSLSVAGYFVARRAGLGPVQDAYVKNLEGNNRILGERVDLIEESLKSERKVRARLARHIERLERTVVSLAEENDYLRRSAGLPKRARPKTMPPDEITPLLDPDYEVSGDDSSDVRGHKEEPS